MVLEKACKKALQSLVVGHAAFEHVQLFKSQILAPEKVPHSACLSVELYMHPNRQFPGHFQEYTYALVFVCFASCHGSIVFLQGGGGVTLPTFPPWCGDTVRRRRVLIQGGGYTFGCAEHIYVRDDSTYPICRESTEMCQVHLHGHTMHGGTGPATWEGTGGIDVIHHLLAQPTDFLPGQ